MNVDFGRTSDDYARHRAGFPPQFFDLLLQRGVARPGSCALDLGTGTGSILRGLAVHGVHAIGLDPSAPQLEAALRLSAAEGLAARLTRARAEALPFQDGVFDLVAAGQCWHWFDGRRAAREARRVLRGGACLVLAGFDWLAPRGGVAEMTNALVKSTNPGWSYWVCADLTDGWIADLSSAGFEHVETVTFDVDVPYSHAGWRGRIRACHGIGASLPHDQVASFDELHARMLSAKFPREPLVVPHRVLALIAR